MASLNLLPALAPRMVSLAAMTALALILPAVSGCSKDSSSKQETPAASATSLMVQRLRGGMGSCFGRLVMNLHLDGRRPTMLTSPLSVPLTVTGTVTEHRQTRKGPSRSSEGLANSMPMSMSSVTDGTRRRDGSGDLGCGSAAASTGGRRNDSLAGSFRLVAWEEEGGSITHRALRTSRDGGRPQEVPMVAPGA